MKTNEVHSGAHKITHHIDPNPMEVGGDITLVFVENEGFYHP